MNTLIILSPLAVGYLIKLSQPQLLKLIGHALTAMVYLILIIMGMGLASLDNLGEQMGNIAQMVTVLVGLTLIANLAALPLVDRWLPLTVQLSEQQSNTAAMVRESVQLALVVIGGFLLGLVIPLPHSTLDPLALGILMAILLLIGIQMRAANMSLRQILLNPRGLAIAAVVLITSLAAGAAMAWLFELPIPHGLAIASGVGWYSLSGAMISQELGPMMGSVAFLSDLARELVAIVLIPMLMRRTPAGAIGYGGATSMDFTLPMIQKSGGPMTVPVAIVSGFLLSLSAPILIPLFLGWA
ncbi:lysine exporter LysO family protein [Ferrimonas senticii]|uniref:lysine exporter LysO family protein n=1 Tax=Ferrimonas senticii TaxID=394566 RepID=UPI0003F88544|nr:lysine exporter LysO family protein [Ferrimonas senticii]